MSTPETASTETEESAPVKTSANKSTNAVLVAENEIGVADAGYVRCGYLLTVPDRLAEACRGNVAMLKGLGLDTDFLTPAQIHDVEPEMSLDGVEIGRAHV